VGLKLKRAHADIDSMVVYTGGVSGIPVRSNNNVVCQACGFLEHADVVGARNVRERGIKLVPVPGLGMAARGDLRHQLVYETRTPNTRALALTG